MPVIQESWGTPHEENADKFCEMALSAGFALRTD
jgi:hypothetical protein